MCAVYKADIAAERERRVEHLGRSGCGGAGLAPQLAVAGVWRTVSFSLVPGVTMVVTATFSMLCYPVGVSTPAEVRPAVPHNPPRTSRAHSRAEHTAAPPTLALATSCAGPQPSAGPCACLCPEFVRCVLYVLCML